MTQGYENGQWLPQEGRVTWICLYLCSIIHSILNKFINKFSANISLMFETGWLAEKWTWKECLTVLDEKAVSKIVLSRYFSAFICYMYMDIKIFLWYPSDYSVSDFHHCYYYRLTLGINGSEPNASISYSFMELRGDL